MKIRLPNFKVFETKETSVHKSSNSGNSFWVSDIASDSVHFRSILLRIYSLVSDQVDIRQIKFLVEYLPKSLFFGPNRS